MASTFSIFKQKMTEVFVKDAKTSDSQEFLDKLKNIWASDAKISLYLKNATDFVDHTTELLNQNKIFAEAIYLLYQNSAYEPQVRVLMHELGKTQDKIDRM